jgi:hypothetical protein
MNETQIGRMLEYLHDIRDGVRALGKTPSQPGPVSMEKYNDAIEIMKLCQKARREKGYGFQMVANYVDSFLKKWGDFA